MVWLIPALVAPFFFALANMADATLTNRRITSMWALLFFVSVLNILYVPAIFPFDAPHWPTAHQWPVFLLIGFTNAAYLFPYYRALQSDDTSVVSALFS